MLYKWLVVFGMAGFYGDDHPIFVSVTEIGHNAANQTLEISCKIFTDDFETVLRTQNNKKVDLLDANYKSAMNPLVDNYIQKHLSIIADGKPVNMQFLGFEQQEEGTISYYEAKNIATVKKIAVTDNILYEYKNEQMEIIHVMIKGERKSRQLNNPDEKVSFSF